MTVGVVVCTPEQRDLAFEMSERYGRIRAAFPSVDGTKFRGLVREIRRRAKHARREYPSFVGGNSGQFEEVLHQIVPRDSTTFVWSAFKSGICDSADLMAAELFDDFVVSLESRKQRERKDEDELWRDALASTEMTELASSIQKPVRRATANYQYEFRGGWLNGTQQVLEPISFDYVDPREIVEKATHWVGRLHELSKSDEFKLTALVTDPPTSLDSPDTPSLLIAYENALELLREAPRVRALVPESSLAVLANEIRHDLRH